MYERNSFEVLDDEEKVKIMNLEGKMEKIEIVS